MDYHKSMSVPIPKGDDANWQKKGTLKMDGSLCRSLSVVSIFKKSDHIFMQKWILYIASSSSEVEILKPSI